MKGWPTLGTVSWKRFIKLLFKEIQEDRVSNGAAVLAYYLMLSMFPFVIFLLGLIPYLPIEGLENMVMTYLKSSLPGDTYKLFTDVINEVLGQKRASVISFGILLTVWSASNGLFTIMDQLNVTYDVREGRPFWKVRGLSILLMFVFLFSLFCSFALILLGGKIQAWMESTLGLGNVLTVLFQVFRWAIIVLFLLLCFALTYYYGPDVEQEFRFITPGSAIGVLTLIAASMLFRLYLENFANFSAIYGSLGSVIALMFWLYIIGLVILLGSEVNALLEHFHQEGKSKGEKALD